MKAEAQRRHMYPNCERRPRRVSSLGGWHETLLSALPCGIVLVFGTAERVSG
jgi:hypothetical protein